MAIALHFIAERANHLAVTGIATFADVDVTPSQFERRVRPHAFHFLDRVVDPEKRRDFDDPADNHCNQSEQPLSRVMFFSSFLCFSANLAMFLSPLLGRYCGWLLNYRLVGFRIMRRFGHRFFIALSFPAIVIQTL